MLVLHFQHIEHKAIPSSVYTDLVEIRSILPSVEMPDSARARKKILSLCMRLSSASTPAIRRGMTRFLNPPGQEPMTAATDEETSGRLIMDRATRNFTVYLTNRYMLNVPIGDPRGPAKFTGWEGKGAPYPWAKNARGHLYLEAWTARGMGIIPWWYDGVSEFDLYKRKYGFRKSH